MLFITFVCNVQLVLYLKRHFQIGQYFEKCNFLFIFFLTQKKSSELANIHQIMFL